MNGPHAKPVSAAPPHTLLTAQEREQLVQVQRWQLERLRIAFPGLRICDRHLESGR
jgi:hypothetical protein